jgi:hypothetical protein
MFLIGGNAPFSKGLLSHLSRQFEIRPYVPGDITQQHDVFICTDEARLSFVPTERNILLVLPFHKDLPTVADIPYVSTIQIGTDVADAEYTQAIRSLFGFSKVKHVIIGHPILATPHPSFPEVVPVHPLPAKISVGKPIRKRRKISTKPVIYAFVVLLISLSIPFISLGVAVSSIYLSLKVALVNPMLSLSLNNISRVASRISEVTLGPLTALPLVKPQVSYFLQLATLSSDASHVVDTGMLILSQVQAVGGKIGKGERINWSTTGSTVAPLIASLYKDGSFLLAHGGEVLSANVLNKGVDLPYLFSFLPAAEHITSRAGILAGENRAFTYMVLFQNAAELRPTGGFLGSYYLVTMQQGKVVSKEIQDVYDADGKINGYIKPPLPVTQYLHEASWHMRDANWDIDFPSTAERISWFLEKATDIKPDAIIAINTIVLSRILSVTGPVHPVGWESDAVTSENLYQMLERRGGDPFFPGSIRKKTYLSGLSESVMNSISTLPKDKILELGKQLEQLTRSKEIMVWFKDEGLQTAVSDAKVSGDFTTGDCGESCTSVVHQIVEANVGVNKVNPYIERSVQESVTKEGSMIQGDVVLSLAHKGGYVNNGNESYKSYVRLLLPKEASADSVKITSSTRRGTVPAELSHEDKYLSAGAFVEVLPGETAVVSFHWRLKSEASRAQIYWIKQPGVLPFTVSLTAAGVGVYNTSLTDSKIFNLQK